MTHTRSAFVRRNQGILLYEANMRADEPANRARANEQTGGHGDKNADPYERSPLEGDAGSMSVNIALNDAQWWRAQGRRMAQQSD